MKVAKLPAVLLLALTMPVSSAAVADSTIVSERSHKAQSPEIAVGPDQAINIVWLDEVGGSVLPSTEHEHANHGDGMSHLAATNLYFARSTDGGRTFTPPTQVNAANGDVWGFPVSKPRIVVGSNGTIHVFYPGNAVSPSNGKPVAIALYTRSTDAGRTFAAPQRLNTMVAGDNSNVISGGLANGHVFGTMAVDSKQNVFAMWLDTRDMYKEGTSAKVYMAISRDDGRFFSADLETFPADVCPCCQLTAFVDSQDRLYIGSRQVDQGFRDSTIAMSTDGGRTFMPRQRIVGNRWVINGCPLKPTVVVANGKNVYATYFTGGESPQGVYFVRSADGGKTYSSPMLVHPGAVVSDAPVMTLAGGNLHLVWQAKLAGSARRLYTRASSNGGRSFGPVQELPAQQGAVQLPVVAARSDGQVQLAWQQDNEIRTMTWASSRVR